MLVVGNWDMYAPYGYAIDAPNSPAIRYFPTAPGPGYVDSSIFPPRNLLARAGRSRLRGLLVASAGVDTVVLEQVCDIKTSIRADVKQALVAWVAQR